MLLIAGLGNPGEEYARTYHNLGFMVVDRLAERHGIRVSRRECNALVGAGEIAGRPVLLAKPQTFMNCSGSSVKPLMQKYEMAPGDLLVIYDELDLPWTSLRIRPRGSAGGHHGVESLIGSLGTPDFPRLRLGVHPGRAIRDGAEFLLSPIPRQQHKELEELLDRAAEAVASMIAEGVEKSMTKYNRRAPEANIEEA